MINLLATIRSITNQLLIKAVSTAVAAADHHWQLHNLGQPFYLRMSVFTVFINYYRPFGILLYIILVENNS